MRIFSAIIIFSLLSTTAVFAQNHCDCESDSMIAQNISCEPILLKNGAKLFYQFDCDSIWLIHQGKNGKKKNIFSTNTEYAGYHYRLDYYLVKEFRHSLLFRYGCPATGGGCSYSLHDKDNGNLLEDFGDLIYDCTYMKDYSIKVSNNNFIIYYSDSLQRGIALYYVDNHKKYYFPLDTDQFDIRFESPVVDKKLKRMRLDYTYINPDADYSDLKERREIKASIVIDLKKYHP